MWTVVWPKEVGCYWFYGWLFGHEDTPAEMHLVRVFQGANSLVYVPDVSAFMYKSEAIGIWTKAYVPEPDEALLDVRVQDYSFIVKE